MLAATVVVTATCNIANHSTYQCSTICNDSRLDWLRLKQSRFSHEAEIKPATKLLTKTKQHIWTDCYEYQDAEKDANNNSIRTIYSTTASELEDAVA